jgi:hypothetical protein
LLKRLLLFHRGVICKLTARKLVVLLGLVRTMLLQLTRILGYKVLL